MGNDGITELTNGNYVILSAQWDNGTAQLSGAATWASGTTPITGFISSANSLIGSEWDTVGGGGITALSNGNYIVNSPRWGNTT